ncbi:hypothetical protein [Microbacterium halotolerans]|uniref:hypothetical protein n=1 Tax=Microbacterium halotolerans TaxID=246613 RepID=UPI0013C3735A|nr:hypothetical protein [Microbacterium halotolerans]
MTHLANQGATDPSDVDVRLQGPISKDDVAAYLAFITERYPLLREALDRVADELVEEGVDLQRLSSGDLSAR